MSLADVFCQDRAIDSLQRAFGAGKLAHAHVFVGAKGVGKFTTAKQWAKVLLCHDRVVSDRGGIDFHDSCGKCSSCMVFEGEGHPDFKHIYKELVKFTEKGKGKTSPVDMPKDVIDEFLLSTVSARPQMSDRVVYVIDEAERMNASSQNALLKVLEEPPAHCSIILLCSRLDRILPTTLSRCQVIRFSPIDEDRIVEKLHSVGTGTEEGVYWARFSQGSIGVAINWAGLDLAEGSCFAIKQKLIRGLARQSLGDSIEFAEWITASVKKISTAWVASDKETSKTDITRRVQEGLLHMIIAALGDVMRLGVGADDGLVNVDQLEDINLLASKCTAEQAAERIEKTYENIRWIHSSVNEKLIFEELLLNYGGSGII
jgi:DNA polymerase-3 subunit delta'